jgi:hypothetical protein
MFISFRVTRKGVVLVIVAAILLRLFFMAMDGVDRFSSDWNRATGASMPNASAVRDRLDHARSFLPNEVDEWVANAEANANNSESLWDVIAGVAEMFSSNPTTDKALKPYGTPDNLENPYDRYAE